MSEKCEWTVYKKEVIKAMKDLLRNNSSVDTAENRIAVAFEKVDDKTEDIAFCHDWLFNMCSEIGGYRDIIQESVDFLKNNSSAEDFKKYLNS